MSSKELANLLPSDLAFKFFKERKLKTLNSKFSQDHRCNPSEMLSKIINI